MGEHSNSMLHTSVNCLTIKCGCIRWNMSMLTMLTNHRDVQQKEWMKRKRERRRWKKGKKRVSRQRQIGEVRDEVEAVM